MVENRGLIDALDADAFIDGQVDDISVVQGLVDVEIDRTLARFHMIGVIR